MDYTQFTKRVYCAINQIEKQGLKVGLSFNATVDQTTGIWRTTNKATRHPLALFLEGHKAFTPYETTKRALARRLGVPLGAIRAFQSGYVGSLREYAQDNSDYFEFGRAIRDKVLRRSTSTYGIW